MGPVGQKDEVNGGMIDVKKPSVFTEGLSQLDAWQFPTLAWGDPTLPSALRRFTAEFGMGSGGTTALVPPGKFYTNRYALFCAMRAFGG